MVHGMDCENATTPGCDCDCGGARHGAAYRLPPGTGTIHDDAERDADEIDEYFKQADKPMYDTLRIEEMPVRLQKKLQKEQVWRAFQKKGYRFESGRVPSSGPFRLGGAGDKHYAIIVKDDSVWCPECKRYHTEFEALARHGKR